MIELNTSEMNKSGTSTAKPGSGRPWIRNVMILIEAQIVDKGILW